MTMAAPIRGVKLLSDDALKLGNFYSDILGWKVAWEDLLVTPEGDPRHLGQYGVVDTGYPADAFVSIQPAGYSAYWGAPAEPGVTFAVMVKDMDAVIARVRGAGGQVLVGPVYVSPRGGFQAIIADPDGNHVALWKPGQDWERDAWAERLGIGGEGI